MKQDISTILFDWPYDEDSNVRRIVGEDGKDKIQVRLQMGVEQYEVDGRPDGRLIKGYDSYLDYYRSVVEEEGSSWKITSREFAHLYDEGLLFYCRYLLFFKMGEYELCARDTARNLELADFVLENAEAADVSDIIEQYRPYMLRMHAVSVAVLNTKKGNLKKSLHVLDTAIKTIQSLDKVSTQVFRLEKARSLVALRDLRNQIKYQKKTFSDMEEAIQNPLSRLQVLKQELSEAVKKENYERAAVLRDKINSLNVEDAVDDDFEDYL